jgi:tyrosyl-tRNA synthetase
MSTDNYDDLLSRGVEEVIGKEDIIKQIKSGKKLRVKFGIDPTGSDIHLGHLVCLNKLKEFQERGHKVVLVMGDYTAKIGDPSGRSKTRVPLTGYEVKKNMQGYLKKIDIFLDTKKCEIVYNSKWFEKEKANLILELASKQTVARVLERNDFQERMKKGDDISLQELFYPLLQAYDSVMVKSDLEIGGTDQKFNMLMGRDIERRYQDTPQSVMTLPLLVGLDGQKKMSKSYNNYIAIDEPSNIQYGKVMSIPDELIVNYFELITRISGKELERIKKEVKNDKKLRDLKAELAREIVSICHGSESAVVSEEEFNRVFRNKEYPIDIPEIEIKNPRCTDLPQLIFDLKLTVSKSEARRLIQQGGVKVDKAVINDPQADICFHDKMVLQVGKFKFVKIRI